MFWLVVIGLVVAELLVTQIVHRRNTRKRAARTARTIVDDTMALYSGRHEFAEVRAADFRDLNHEFYNRAQAELESFGFRHLADIEDRTASRQMPAMRTFIRVLIGDHQSTTAAIYHLKFRGFHRLLQWVGVLPRKPFFVDLESEFSDGIFLATSNTRGNDLSSDYPGIQRQTLPAETPISQLIVAHREQFASLCQEGRNATRLSGLAEVHAMQHRLQEAKNRHKKRLGYVDGEQIGRAIARFENNEAHDELARQLRVLREQNLAASSTVNTRAV